jgi:DNA-binding transcriptional LysR family regulator
VPLASLVALGLVAPPPENPLRYEVEAVAAQQGIVLPINVEVEGIRLVADLVAAGAGGSVLPETAVPADLDVQMLPIAGMPPRRLAIVNARDAQLSFADGAVRETVLAVVADRLRPRAASAGRPR